jgi:hypothetical protein
MQTLVHGSRNHSVGTTWHKRPRRPVRARCSINAVAAGFSRSACAAAASKSRARSSLVVAWEDDIRPKCFRSIGTSFRDPDHHRSVDTSTLVEQTKHPTCTRRPECGKSALAQAGSDDLAPWDHPSFQLVSTPMRSALPSSSGLGTSTQIGGRSELSRLRRPVGFVSVARRLLALGGSLGSAPVSDDVDPSGSCPFSS